MTSSTEDRVAPLSACGVGSVMNFGRFATRSWRIAECSAQQKAAGICARGFRVNKLKSVVPNAELNFVATRPQTPNGPTLSGPDVAGVLESFWLAVQSRVSSAIERAQRDSVCAKEQRGMVQITDRMSRAARLPPKANSRRTSPEVRFVPGLR